jgi:DNA-binding SARP family transcriptional activator
MAPMSALRVFLFGKFHLQLGEHVLTSLGSGKVQELFCYLLLHRDRSHPREYLANLLWSDSPTTQSKKYLRQNLWQLQAAMRPQTEPANSRLLLLDDGWVRLNPKAGLWLDAAVFEQAFTLAQGVPGRELDDRGAQALQTAVYLYEGDLLEGCYQDWCLYERERFRNMYLAMLGKLAGYCEAHHEYEAGLVCGNHILRYDRARERTHRQLMRMYYLAGDRTAALRQYERCAAALDEELGVKPARSTVALYQQIRADQLDGPAYAPVEASTAVEATAATLPEVLGRLKQLKVVLADVQRQLQQNIQAVEMALNGQC